MADEASRYVGRTVGFGATEERAFVAEVTFRTADGGVKTVSEYGRTAWGALTRAEATARRTLTSRRRASGFYRGERWRTPNTKATFPIGFSYA